MNGEASRAEACRCEGGFCFGAIPTEILRCLQRGASFVDASFSLRISCIYTTLNWVGVFYAITSHGYGQEYCGRFFLIKIGVEYNFAID